MITSFQSSKVLASVNIYQIVMTKTGKEVQLRGLLYLANIKTLAEHLTYIFLNFRRKITKEFSRLLNTVEDGQKIIKKIWVNTK